jgi:hypothetical protein
MSAQGAVSFIIIEAVLAICMLLGVWLIKKLATDGQLQWLLCLLCYVIFGGIMFVKLLNFAGIM